MPPKNWLWHLPTYIDRWRLVPRALMAVYMMLLVQVSNWFMTLDVPNGPQSAFVAAVWAAGAAWFGLYLNKPAASSD